MKVALVGGFGAPPALLRPLRDALRTAGYTARIAPLGINVDCGEKTVQRLDGWLTEFAAGEPVALVGHSRGGQLARVVAVRHPERVTRLVTVNTPWTIGPPDRPGVQQVASLIRLVRRAGIDLMGSLDCATDACCAQYRVDVAAKPAVRWSALWSSRDSMAGDEARPPREADDVVDTRTGHVGAVTTKAGIAAIASALDM